MAFALVLFVILLIVGRSELGISGIAICIALFVVLITAVAVSGSQPIFIAAGTALLDIGMILFIFGGDIPIRPKT